MDTANNDREFLLQCLARWICDLPLENRTRFLKAFKEKHGNEVFTDIDRRAREEWRRRRAAADR